MSTEAEIEAAARALAEHERRSADWNDVVIAKIALAAAETLIRERLAQEVLEERLTDMTGDDGDDPFVLGETADEVARNARKGTLYSHDPTWTPPTPAQDDNTPHRFGPLAAIAEKFGRKAG